VIHQIIGKRLVLDDVVEGDNPARAHELLVVVIVLGNTRLGVVAVDEQEIHFPATKLLRDALSSKRRDYTSGDLRRAILRASGWTSGGETVYLARTRHLDAMKRAAASLSAASTQDLSWEIFAEELRLAQAALNEITGEFTADDLLGAIFTRFCIGK